MKIFTLMLLMLLSWSVGAQIIYTSTDHATAATSLTFNIAPALPATDFSAGGPNHVWDFSALGIETQQTIEFLDPNATGYKLSWCFTNGYFFNCNAQFNSNFNLATPFALEIPLPDLSVSNIVMHSKVSTTSFENRMIGFTATVGENSVPVTTDYEVADVVYQFPIVYGANYTTNGSFSMDFTSAGIPLQYYSAIQRTNTVPGWGSLTTPSGVFPEVLQLKSVTQRTDLINYEGVGMPIPTVTTVSYQWFDKNYDLPVLQADGIEFEGNFVPQTVRYLDASSLATAPVAAGQIALYPNPTSGMLHLSTTLPPVSRVEIYNSIGMLVGKELDLSRHTAGVYLVRIITPEAVFARKVVRR